MYKYVSSLARKKGCYTISFIKILDLKFGKINFSFQADERGLSMGYSCYPYSLPIYFDIHSTNPNFSSTFFSSSLSLYRFSTFIFFFQNINFFHLKYK